MADGKLFIVGSGCGLCGWATQRYSVNIVIWIRRLNECLLFGASHFLSPTLPCHVGAWWALVFWCVALFHNMCTDMVQLLVNCFRTFRPSLRQLPEWLKCYCSRAVPRTLGTQNIVLCDECFSVRKYLRSKTTHSSLQTQIKCYPDLSAPLTHSPFRQQSTEQSPERVVVRLSGNFKNFDIEWHSSSVNWCVHRHWPKRLFVSPKTAAGTKKNTLKRTEKL